MSLFTVLVVAITIFFSLNFKDCSHVRETFEKSSAHNYFFSDCVGTVPQPRCLSRPRETRVQPASANSRRLSSSSSAWPAATRCPGRRRGRDLASAQEAVLHRDLGRSRESASPPRRGRASDGGGETRSLRDEAEEAGREATTAAGQQQHNPQHRWKLDCRHSGQPQSNNVSLLPQHQPAAIPLCGS